MSYFRTKWEYYLCLRHLNDGKGPIFPKEYDVRQRDKFYRELSFSGMGGASGYDAPLIAWDALLGARNNWEELCLRGVLHGGDSDSTGAMAGAWFGALYGFKGVPLCNYQKLEYLEELITLGTKLFEKAQLKRSKALDPNNNKHFKCQLIEPW